MLKVKRNIKKKMESSLHGGIENMGLSENILGKGQGHNVKEKEKKIKWPGKSFGSKRNIKNKWSLVSMVV